MTHKISHFFADNWIFASPFLIGFYPAIFLYSQNISVYAEQVLLSPLLLSLILILVVFGICKLFFKTLKAASPIASILIFILLSYDIFYDQLQSAHLGILSTEIFYLIFVLIVVGFIIYFIRKSKSLNQVNKFLTVSSFLLLIFAIIPIVTFEVKEGRVWRATPQAFRIKANQKIKPPTNAPDIYYIMPEDYSASKTLLKEYGFNNSSFLNSLKKKGFYVAEDSTSNYPKTFLSLASSLNMEYVNFLTQQTNGGASSDESFATPLIQNNKVVKFLKDHGYKYIHVGSWWAPTATNPNADKNFTPYKNFHWGTDEFTTGFIGNSAFARILNFVRFDSSNISNNPRDNDHRVRMFYQFETGEKIIPQIEGPKFVFIHIMAPHEPFVVDRNCKPISEQQAQQKTLKDNLIEQIQCVNNQLINLTNTIISKSDKPPVILLQTDEGGFPINYPLDDTISWSTASKEALNEKFPILNAFYFPGKNNPDRYSSLYQSITPVNSFRIIFNKYFGANLPLLTDKNFIFQDANNLYKFSEVTNKLKD